MMRRMKCMRFVLPSLTVLLSATTEAVCNPTLTYSNAKLSVGYGQTRNVLNPATGTTYAVGVADRQIYAFDTSDSSATINILGWAGDAAVGAWAGDQVNGANARFTSYGGVMKPGGTMVYFSITNALAQVQLSGTYPVTQFAGDQAVTPAACTEGDGTAARLANAYGPAIADATGDTVLVPVYYCHRLALVGTNSPHTATWELGTGSSSTTTAAGYGTSAPIKWPIAVTSFRNRFYASASAAVLVIRRAADWQLVIISDGQGPTSTTTNIPFDNNYAASGEFIFQGSFSTWSNCWLHIYLQGNQIGHIVDPEGGNMFLLAGITSAGSTKFATADLFGNVWVSGDAGYALDLGKYSIAYTGCPALSPNKCKWPTSTATATLQEVPSHTRTATPPMTTPGPPPPVPGPVTTTAVSSSASASSGGAATISAATSVAATTTVVGTTAAATISAATSVGATTAATTSVAATTAVVGTTAPATAAAVTTTVATSTTAAAGSSSSSSGSTGNGASSVTAAALGLVTMVLAMF